MTREDRSGATRPPGPSRGLSGHGDATEALPEAALAVALGRRTLPWLPNLDADPAWANWLHRPRCESGWTGDRCTFPLHHAGPHSNDGWEDHLR